MEAVRCQLTSGSPLLGLLGMCINSIKGENKLNNNITKLADFNLNTVS